MATIDFNAAHTASLLSTGSPPAVYTRATWASPWVLAPNLYVERATFATAPVLPTATLRYFYGSVILPGDTTATALAKISVRGHFVKIEYTDDAANVIPWIGFIESPIELETIGTNGAQLLPAYGLDRALQICPIVGTVFVNESAALTLNGTPAVFNRDGNPNRSTAKTDGAYTFATAADPDYWSTRDIVEYLIVHQLAADSTLDWQLTGASVIPDDDQPTLAVEGLTVADALNQLLGADSLLTYSVRYDGVTNKPAVHVSSQLPSVLALPGAGTFAAATTQHTINYDADPLTQPTLSEDSLDVYDQVIVESDHRTTVCTLGEHVTTNFGALWSDADETAYEAGASGDAGYAALDEFDKRSANATIRNSPELAEVYSHVGLKPTVLHFNTLATNGLWPDGEDFVEVRLQDVQVLPDLPLYEGIDYTGDPTAVDEADGRRNRPIFLALQESEFDLWFPAAELGNQQNTIQQIVEWSITISAETLPGSVDFYLQVSGAPQHAIGAPDFTPLPADTMLLGDFSHALASITCALQDPRRLEARYPTTTPSVDVLRRKRFRVPGYTAVYIHPDTVVGVENHELTKSTGGILRDDSAQLERLATILGRYYTTARQSLTIRTVRRTSVPQVGDLLTNIGAPITRIEFVTPIATGQGRPAAASQSITATQSRIDFPRLIAKN